VCSRLPSITEPLGIEVADDRVLVGVRRDTGGRVVRIPPSTPGGSSVWKMPGQDQRVLRLGPGGDVALQANRADRIALRRLRPKLAVVGKIVPEQQRAG